MKLQGLALLAAVAACPATAQDTREMDSHVHGVGALEIAVEGSTVEMSLTSPGMDIVGFEYEASSAEDHAAIGAAVAQLARADEVLTLPVAAECALNEVLSHLHAGEHDHHGEGQDHDGEDHADENATEADESEAHTEFHARYVYHCASPEALNTVTLGIFELYEGSEGIEVQYVTGAGQGVAEATPDAPEIALD